MKKIYNQPTLEVVRMNNNDIVTLSTYGKYNGSDVILAPDRFNDWYEGY